ncbi:hypothetical protein TorRG33x02_201440 [Trema orientale]|uniref:Uncharacterized protein n=1 Tax=Trema orientale TaxID=63057 RepID=A0A2P5EES0_TREOI|nr:hypothetical protein TorRG33x02_201440 [Trema orientale]
MNSEEEVGRLAVMEAREHKIFCNNQAVDDSIGTGAVALKRKDDIQNSSVIKSSTRGKEKMGEARVQEAMMMLNKEDNTAPFCNTSQYQIVSTEETDIPLKSLLDNPGAISGNKANKKEDNMAPFCNTSQYSIVSTEETDIPLKSLLDNPGAISGNKANKKVRC